MRVAEERRHGGLTERVLQATAASYIVSPAALGATATPNRLSARYLIALAARLLREVARLDEKQHTLALDAEVRFRTPADRNAFAEDLVRGRDGGHRTPPPRRRPAAPARRRRPSAPKENP